MVLDMSNPAVIDYLKASFTETFAGVPIDYFKWDMNRHISEPGSPTLAPEDQGSLEYRYMLGVYSLFDWFTKQYPDAMIENCSGGGGRYDPAMMYFTSQIWTSDNTSARDRVLIQYSSQLAYPASVMSCHVSNPKGDLRELDLKYKVAVGGILGYEFNVLNTPDEIKDEIRRQVARYRTFDRLIQFGTHYRLSSPYETGISAYYYRLDGEILLSAILTDGKAVIGKKKALKKLAVRTADKDAVYRDAISGVTYTGAQLRAGIEIGEFAPDATGYDAKLWHFQKI
jgi:alpha-galactosidase